MQKWIKKYWPVLLLLLAVGYIIYIRRRANNTIGTPANTEPVNWGANPEQPTNGIAPGEPVGTTPGNSTGTATGSTGNTGGAFLPVYDPNAGNTGVISDPLPWMQNNQDTIKGTGNAATINFY